MPQQFKKIIHWLGKHRTLVIAAAAVIVVAGATIGYRAGEAAAAGSKRELPIYCVDRDDKIAALTFDAAWGDEDTPDILKTLDEYGVKATFFLVGEWVDKYPEQVAAMIEAGHDVMNHSDTHAHMAKLNRDQIVSEIVKCNEKIKAISGESPVLFRCPYGEYNNAVVETLRDLGMYTIQWDVDSLDWKDLTAQKIMERVVPKVNPGSIVLFHNGGKHTAEALPGVIEALLEQNYKLVKVRDMIYKDNFELDHTGKQIQKTSVD